ncbi:hypothetical protein [Stutzerimonas nitrititolerans]|nr:hypothetical protein [Stutzerimonas nitrititolerans]
MKRLHAILIFTHLVACVCLMVGVEAWKVKIRMEEGSWHAPHVNAVVSG